MPLIETSISKLLENTWPGLESTEAGRRFTGLLQRLVSWDPDERRVHDGAFVDRSARVTPGMETPPAMERRISPPRVDQGPFAPTRALNAPEFDLSLDF